MAKIKLNSLPEGFEIKNGKVVKKMQQGGSTMGQQENYGLVTNPYLDGGSNSDSNSDSVRYSLSSVPKDIANIEAEGGETVLTDLNNDGQFGLYNINGPRHGSGGVPMFLPEQSFVYSDTSKMKFGKETLSEFGISSKKKMTPAKVSKKFPLNKYFGVMNNDDTDKIGLKSAELMIAKNGGQLSKLSFAQESKKQFSDGVPVTSHPYLISQGIDPIEFTQKVENINRQQAMQKAMSGMSPQQLEQMLMMQQMMQQAGQMPQQGPPQEPMMDESMEMARYGAELEKYQDGNEKTKTAVDLDLAKRYANMDIKINQEGIEETKYKPIQAQKKKGYYGDAIRNTPGFLKRFEGIYPDLDNLLYAVENQKGRGSNPVVAKYQRWLNETYIPSVVEDMKQQTLAVGKNWSDNQTETYTASLIKDYGFNNDSDNAAETYDGKWGTVSSSKSPISFTITADEGIKVAPQEEVEPDLIEPNEYTPVGEEPEIPMYIQDKIKMANTAMLNPRKGRPFVSQINTNSSFRTKSPVYMAQAALAKDSADAQAVMAYAGPQAGSSRMAANSGNTLQNLSGIIDRVQGSNVDGLNQFLARDSAMNLNVDQYNAGAREREYDKNEASMENYNNWMNKRNTLFSNQLSNAYTNRSDARNVSNAFPNMSIDTNSGGDIFMRNPRAINATRSSTPAELKAQRERDLNHVMQMFPNIKDPGKTADWLNGQKANNAYTPNNIDPNTMDPAQVAAMLQAMKAKQGKEIKKYATPFYSGKVGGF